MEEAKLLSEEQAKDLLLILAKATKEFWSSIDGDSNRMKHFLQLLKCDIDFETEENYES